MHLKWLFARKTICSSSWTTIFYFWVCYVIFGFWSASWKISVPEFSKDKFSMTPWPTRDNQCALKYPNDDWSPDIKFFNPDQWQRWRAAPKLKFCLEFDYFNQWSISIPYFIYDEYGRLKFENLTPFMHDKVHLAMKFSNQFFAF